MAYKFNPFTKNLDFHTHAGVLSYTFAGWTEESPPVTAPGTGKFTLNVSGLGYELVISTTDKNGRDLGYVLMILLLIGWTEIYDIWFWFHSKRDPKLYYGLWMMPDDLDTIDVDGVTVAWIIPMVPFFVSMTYDPVEDDYTDFDIPVGDEVLLSMDFGFNPDYIGTMGTQDSDAVSITGGTISIPVNIHRPDGTPVADPGWASSSTIDMTAPDGYATFNAEDGTPVVVPYWIKAGV